MSISLSVFQKLLDKLITLYSSGDTANERILQFKRVWTGGTFSFVLPCKNCFFPRNYQKVPMSFKILMVNIAQTVAKKINSPILWLNISMNKD